MLFVLGDSGMTMNRRVRTGGEYLSEAAEAQTSYDTIRVVCGEVDLPAPTLVPVALN